ncbi:MAG: zf-HC2 domain-containing protein [Acidobacteria bacterium]|nr:zf-HC2 domain-containing protein [Acidobacteriota bacterium]
MTRPAAPKRAARRTPRPTPGIPRCPEADAVWPYLDGELSAARARAVARHLRTCPGCTGRAHRLRAMLEACRAAGCEKLPAAVRARARSRVRTLLAPAGKNS